MAISCVSRFPSFLYGEISRRGDCLLNAGKSVCRNSLYTVSGMVAILPSILHLTLSDEGTGEDEAQFLLSCSKRILADSYVSLLFAVNPLARFKTDWIERTRAGFFLARWRDSLFDQGIQWAKSSSCLDRHVLSRLAGGCTLLVSTITAVADAAIACVAVPLSFLTGGKFRLVNAIALQSLQCTGVLYDIGASLVFMSNPSDSESFPPIEYTSKV